MKKREQKEKSLMAVRVCYSSCISQLGCIARQRSRTPSVGIVCLSSNRNNQQSEKSLGLSHYIRQLTQLRRRRN